MQTDNYRTFFKIGKKGLGLRVLPWQQNILHYQLCFTLHCRYAKFHFILTSNINWAIGYLNSHLINMQTIWRHKFDQLWLIFAWLLCHLPSWFGQLRTIITLELDTILRTSKRLSFCPLIDFIGENKMIVKILFHLHLTNKVNCSAKMFLKHVIHTLGLPNYQVKLVFGITKGISELKNSKSSLHLLFYIPRFAL